MILQKIKRKIYKLFHPPVGEILMLHRVVENRSLLDVNRQMEITPQFLEKTLQIYQRKGYQFVSLDEVHEIVSKQMRPKQKFVCFTFDDGYADNYELAYPIFKKYNCPFVIYVTTDFPDGKAAMWWYVLEVILKENDTLVLGDGTNLPALTIEEKNEAFDNVRSKVFNAKGEDMERFVGQLLNKYTFSFSTLAERLALSWDQIEELSFNPLCTIGSHTVTHSPLTNLSTKELEKELRGSKSMIEKHINKLVVHFAYPYGIYNQKVTEFVKKAGYKTATLANGGKVRLEEQSEFKIKRISLVE
jgi:peptidoglycan/xylan/chitin deacetylase (PgdA/CDA1 family)